MEVYKQSSIGEWYKISHKSLSIGENLEMTHTVVATPWVVDETNTPIKSKRQEIEEVVLNPLAKERLLSQYRPIEITSSTSNRRVNAQGELVDRTLVQEEVDGFIVENYEWPEGSISELEYWQNIPLSIVPGITKGSEWVYAMIQHALLSTKI